MRTVCNAVFREQLCLISVARLRRSTATAMLLVLLLCRQLSTAWGAWLDMTSHSIRSVTYRSR